MTATRTTPAGKLTASALVLASLLLVAGEMLHPERSTDPARQLAIVDRNPTAWYASHLLLFLGIALTVPAIVGIAFLLRDAAPRLAIVGGGLAFVGSILFTGLLTIGFVVWQMASVANRHEMVALFRRLFHAPGFAIPFEMLPLTFAIGMVILAVGLRRVGVVPRWVAVTWATGAVMVSLVGIVPGSAYAVTSSVVLAVGMTATARILLPPAAATDTVRAQAAVR